MSHEDEGSVAYKRVPRDERGVTFRIHLVAHGRRLVVVVGVVVVV